jgi:hypothetical protein
MRLLIALFSLSHSYFCKKTFEIQQNVPESYGYPLGDAEVLCINSTFLYLRLVPHPATPLKIRYFSRTVESTQVLYPLVIYVYRREDGFLKFLSTSFNASQ